MDIKQEQFFPQIHYFDPDFVTMYEQSWARIETKWYEPNNINAIPSGYLDYEENPNLDLMEVIGSSFFLLYSNAFFSATHALDFFYRKQEENGAIRSSYNKKTGDPVFSQSNPESIAPPILLWAEYNYYNRTDNKRRLKEILPKLDLYLQWLTTKFQQKNGLFLTPHSISSIHNLPHNNACYFIDFNAQMSLAYFFMIRLATYTNFRNLVFKYTKAYYHLKTVINEYFWNAKDGFYYDLDNKYKQIQIKTLTAFWTLLALIPNNYQATQLKNILSDPRQFNTENTFPTISNSSSMFTEHENGYLGSVYPLYTYMIIKGLALYGYHEFARESAIKHISCILATFYSDNKDVSGAFWEIYQPSHDLPAKSLSKNHPNRVNYFPSVAISTISLLIEHIIGFDICLPKKMVYWTIPHLEFMGIESFQLKRNMISTVIQKTHRGWEIRHSSEKLYYFNVDIQELEKQKTLPIPSGKCSLLLEKL